MLSLPWLVAPPRLMHNICSTPRGLPSRPSTRYQDRTPSVVSPNRQRSRTAHSAAGACTRIQKRPQRGESQVSSLANVTSLASIAISPPPSRAASNGRLYRCRESRELRTAVEEAKSILTPRTSRCYWAGECWDFGYKFFGRTVQPTAQH